MLDSYNPATGKIIGSFEEHSLEDVCAFFETARKNYKNFKTIAYEEKKNWLDKFCTNLINNKNNYAKTLTYEMGKPVQEAASEIEASVRRIKWFIDTTDDFLKQKSMVDNVRCKEKITYDPLGIVLNISAWNYPYFLSSNIFAPGILTGNIVAYKGSEVCPETSQIIEDLLYKSGVPQYAFKSILGGSDLGKKLISLNFDGLFFTGSKNAGKSILGSIRSKLVPITMELGGKDAVYVCDDVVKDQMIKDLVSGAFYNAGQSCCSVERIYVHAKIYDQFVQKFSTKVKSLRLGDPLSSSTEIGPLARKEQLNVLELHKKDALSKGATALVDGGCLPKTNGWYFSPCVLSDTTSEMLVMREESFGPIVGIQKVTNDNEAKYLINQSEYGLTASIYTENKTRALNFLDDLNVGTVYWNFCDRVSPFVPWSGRKNSGIGSTLSFEGISSFLRPKSWQLNLTF